LLQQAPSLRSRWIAKTNLRWVTKIDYYIGLSFYTVYVAGCYIEIFTSSRVTANVVTIGSQSLGHDLLWHPLNLGRMVSHDSSASCLIKSFTKTYIHTKMLFRHIWLRKYLFSSTINERQCAKHLAPSIRFRSPC
jgi:hypothetical protein